MTVRNFSLRLAVVAALLAVAGCGGGGGGPKTKVTGSVTLNGKPLDEGYIVFRAADGKGAEAGAPITSGSYSVSVTEGPKVVVISSAAAPEAGKVLTSEEASKLRVDPKKKDAQVIEPTTKGNNAKVDVKGSEQSLDFTLKTGS